MTETQPTPDEQLYKELIAHIHDPNEDPRIWFGDKIRLIAYSGKLGKDGMTPDTARIAFLNLKDEVRTRNPELYREYFAKNAQTRRSRSDEIFESILPPEDNASRIRKIITGYNTRPQKI